MISRKDYETVVVDIRNRKRPTYPGKGTTPKACEYCGGTGSVYGRECPKCGGLGEVYV